MAVSLEAPPARAAGRGLASLLAGIFLIDLGSAMSVVALPLLLIEKYGITVAVGFTLAVRVIPSILLGPMAGALIARFDPRRMAMVSAAGAGLFTSLIPVTTALWQLQCLTLAVGLASMFAGPTRLVLRARVIESGRELKDNGLLVAVERTPTLIGPPLAVAIGAAFTIGAVFPVQGVLNLAAAALVLGIPAATARTPVPATRTPEDSARTTGGGRAGRARRRVHEAYVDSVRQLVRACVADRFMRGLTLTGYADVCAVAVGRFALMRMGQTTFAHIPDFYGYLVGAMGIGGLAGGLLIGRFAKVGSGRLYIVGNVAEGCLWPLLLLLGDPVTALLTLFAAGILESTATAAFFAEAQKRLDPEQAGYYYAAFIPMTDVCVFAGTVLGSAVVGRSLGLTLLVTGGLIALPVLATRRWYAA